MTKYKTKRFIRGVLMALFLTVLLILWTALRFITPILTKNGIQVLADFPTNALLYLALLAVSLWMLSWALRNKLYYGVSYALTNYLMEKRLRRHLSDADYQTSNELDGTTKSLPKIRIEFYEKKKRESGRIYIQNSIRHTGKLEKVDISSALSSRYLVESQHATLDGSYYYYEFLAVKALEQESFSTLEDYLAWSKETADDYQLRVDSRTTIAITHMGVAGVTGSGKTFLIQALIEQVKSKMFDHLVMVIDPKRSDLFFQAKRLLPDEAYSDAEGALAILRKLKGLLEKRKVDLEAYLMNNPNSTYQEAGLPAVILVIDELGSLREHWKLLSKADRDLAETILSTITFTGRQLGVFLWACTQQMNATTLPTSIRDQLIFKAVLSESDEQTYRTLFSQSVVIPRIKFGPGMGVYSLPQISSTEHPKFLMTPYCKFLKEAYWTAEQAKPAKP